MQGWAEQVLDACRMQHSDRAEVRLVWAADRDSGLLPAAIENDRKGRLGPLASRGRFADRVRRTGAIPQQCGDAFNTGQGETARGTETRAARGIMAGDLFHVLPHGRFGKKRMVRMNDRADSAITHAGRRPYFDHPQTTVCVTKQKASARHMRMCSQNTDRAVQAFLLEHHAPNHEAWKTVLRRVEYKIVVDQGEPVPVHANPPKSAGRRDGNKVLLFIFVDEDRQMTLGTGRGIPVLRDNGTIMLHQSCRGTSGLSRAEIFERRKQTDIKRGELRRLGDAVEFRDEEWRESGKPFDARSPLCLRQVPASAIGRSPKIVESLQDHGTQSNTMLLPALSRRTAEFNNWHLNLAHRKNRNMFHSGIHIVDKAINPVNARVNCAKLRYSVT